MSITLKKSHKLQIEAFFLRKERNDIQGTKLEALYKLIQKRGEPIKITGGGTAGKFQGLKALNIGGGFYISLKHTPIKKGNFYPCKLDQLTLQQL